MTNLEAIAQYRELHQHPQEFRGFSLGPHLERIKALIDETGALTLLDYGCGKARQYTEKGAAEVFGIMPTLYDPAYAPYSAEPKGTFDGVICTDVLEHIPDPIPLAETVIGYARKFVFFSISCRPSKRTKTLPNKLPRHISVHPPAWWRERLHAEVRLELAFDVAEVA